MRRAGGADARVCTGLRSFGQSCALCGVAGQLVGVEASAACRMTLTPGPCLAYRGSQGHHDECGGQPGGARLAGRQRVCGGAGATVLGVAVRGT